MRTRIGLGIAFTLWSGAALLADFSYQQTSKITGGMVASMMKVAGVLSKQAREPIQTTIVVKGDRMATIGPQSAHVVDLKSETITDIDFHRRTYSVMTFAQLTDMMKRADEQMKSAKGKSVQDLRVKASAKETGETKSIGGVDTREAIVKIEMIGTDEKTGQDVTVMVVTCDMWLAKPVAGYEEVRDFHRRMAEKLAWAPNQGMLTQPGMTKGMAELSKEMAKLNGMPILQLITMGGPTPDPGAAGQQQPQPTPQPDQQDQQSSGGMLGKLAGGRFGGFGHKKSQDQDQQQQQQGPPPGAGTLMEMTTELAGFSTDPADTSKFEVPAGFKEVEARTGRR